MNTPELTIEQLKTYTPKNRIRMVTATALFDGHDASINIMRRLLQARGAEVIHLGHNRSAWEIVRAAIQEDAQAIAISSYQGGHMEFFKYVKDLLKEHGAGDVHIFGGGGGVIVPREISELHKYGIDKIFSPEDGQKLSLPGIIGTMLHISDHAPKDWDHRKGAEQSVVGRSLTLLENQHIVDIHKLLKEVPQPLKSKAKTIPVLGITGTGGAGKSSLTDEIITRFLLDDPTCRIGVLCVDPSKRKSGGALLGDRIRMNSASNERVFLRSLATRDSGTELSAVTKDAVNFLKHLNFDFIIVETSGIGQGDAGILKICDVSMYVMTPEYGAQSQLEKIDMLDFADLIAINKFERRQGLDALRDVRQQLRRSRFQGQHLKPEDYPVFGTIASRFADDGVNGLYKSLCHLLNQKIGENRFSPPSHRIYHVESSERQSLVPSDRGNYLGEIAKSVRQYHQHSERQTELVEQWANSKQLLPLAQKNPAASDFLKEKMESCAKSIDKNLMQALEQWDSTKSNYNSDEYKYKVRDQEFSVNASFTTLSHLKIPKVALPLSHSKSEIARYILKENLPGHFPFTAGIFPFRRTAEDPKRQFAGEGGPSRTNQRFHYLCKDDDAKRLSTAFDSVTLYGSEPHERPDIFGKVGESGVSIATLEDMKELYKGFDLCGSNTSVSMTINGPAPIILAMFLNTAIDQQIDQFTEKQKRAPNPSEHKKIYDDTLTIVRGTVQADILKEDQAQNTCIFSTEFALKMMADMQEYFIEKKIRNYYSVSISGYHIAEAGANPISQLAFTLANGFTYVEYYLARGMSIDDFAPNLSFFFSNGIDAEYAVLGRVARRIWSIAMRDVYRANERSQKLKYHIQTSGRSLHAQEIDFNDTRTTLQALVALYDNCNSLHTNAYDEAITTPTEESVRRAMAIQMIINKEFGPNKCENINQGSYFLEKLTDIVEEAVLQEFDRINERGGVLGAMEMQYQRSKIQEESLHYESLKDSGELPIIGVNTFLNPKTLSQSFEREEIQLIRASYEEKDAQLQRLKTFKSVHKDTKTEAVKSLQQAAVEGKNIFAELMSCVRHASLGEITQALYEVGGQYRRSM